MSLAEDFRHADLIKARMIPCGICGRPMSDPVSIRLGMGPSHLKQKAPAVKAKVDRILRGKGLTRAQAEQLGKGHENADRHAFVAQPRQTGARQPAKAKGGVVDVTGQVPFSEDKKAKPAAAAPKVKVGQVALVGGSQPDQPGYADPVDVKVVKLGKNGYFHGVALHDFYNGGKRGDKVLVSPTSIKGVFPPSKYKSEYLNVDEGGDTRAAARRVNAANDKKRAAAQGQTDGKGNVLNSAGEWEDVGNRAERKMVEEEAALDAGPAGVGRLDDLRPGDRVMNGEVAREYEIVRNNGGGKFRVRGEMGGQQVELDVDWNKEHKKNQLVLLPPKGGKFAPAGEDMTLDIGGPADGEVNLKAVPRELADIFRQWDKDGRLRFGPEHDRGAYDIVLDFDKVGGRDGQNDRILDEATKRNERLKAKKPAAGGRKAKPAPAMNPEAVKMRGMQLFAEARKRGMSEQEAMAWRDKKLAEQAAEAKRLKAKKPEGLPGTAERNLLGIGGRRKPAQAALPAGHLPKKPVKGFAGSPPDSDRNKVLEYRGEKYDLMPEGYQPKVGDVVDVKGNAGLQPVRITSIGADGKIRGINMNNNRERGVIPKQIQNAWRPQKRGLGTKTAEVLGLKPKKKKAQAFLPGGQNQPRDTADAKRRAQKPKRPGVVAGMFGSETMRQRDMTVNTKGRAEPRAAVYARRRKRTEDRARPGTLIDQAVKDHTDAWDPRYGKKDEERRVFVGIVAAVREPDGVKAGKIMDAVKDYAKRNDVDVKAVEPDVLGWLKEQGEGLTAPPTRGGQRLDTFELARAEAEFLYPDQNRQDLFVDYVAAHILERDGVGKPEEERMAGSNEARRKGVDAISRKKVEAAAKKYAEDNGIIGAGGVDPTVNRLVGGLQGTGWKDARAAAVAAGYNSRDENIFLMAIAIVREKDGNKGKHNARSKELLEAIDNYGAKNGMSTADVDVFFEEATLFVDDPDFFMERELARRARMADPKKYAEHMDKVRKAAEVRYPNSPVKQDFWIRGVDILDLRSEGLETEADAILDDLNARIGRGDIGAREAQTIYAAAAKWRNDNISGQSIPLTPGAEEYAKVIGGFYNVNIDPEKAPNGPKGFWVNDRKGPFPAAIRQGTPAANHFDKGGKLSDAPEEGLFDFIMQQVGMGVGPGLKPGEEGVQEGGGRRYDPRPIYASADPKHFRVTSLKDIGKAGISDAYFVEQMDDDGNVIDWSMFKGSTGWFDYDIEMEVVNNRLLGEWGQEMPRVEFARDHSHVGPKWQKMQHAVEALYPDAVAVKGEYSGYEFGEGGELLPGQIMKFRKDRKSALSMRMLDYLSGNVDRHDANWMWVHDETNDEYKFVIIDNGGGNFLQNVDFAEGDWGSIIADLYRGEEDQLEADLKDLVNKAQRVDINSVFSEFPGLSPKLKERVKKRYAARLAEFTNNVAPDFVKQMRRRI